MPPAAVAPCWMRPDESLPSRRHVAGFDESVMQEAKLTKARDRAVVPVIHDKTYVIDRLPQGLAQPT